MQSFRTPTPEEPQERQTPEARRSHGRGMRGAGDAWRVWIQGAQLQLAQLPGQEAGHPWTTGRSGVPGFRSEADTGDWEGPMTKAAALGISQQSSATKEEPR